MAAQWHPPTQCAPRQHELCRGAVQALVAARQARGRGAARAGPAPELSHQVRHLRQTPVAHSPGSARFAAHQSSGCARCPCPPPARGRCLAHLLAVSKPRELHGALLGIPIATFVMPMLVTYTYPRSNTKASVYRGAHIITTHCQPSCGIYNIIYFKVFTCRRLYHPTASFAVYRQSADEVPELDWTGRARHQCPLPAQRCRRGAAPRVQRAAQAAPRTARPAAAAAAPGAAARRPARTRCARPPPCRTPPAWCPARGSSAL